MKMIGGHESKSNPMRHSQTSFSKGFSVAQTPTIKTAKIQLTSSDGPSGAYQNSIPQHSLFRNKSPKLVNSNMIDDGELGRNIFEKSLINLHTDESSSFQEQSGLLHSERFNAARTQSSLNVPVRLVGTQNENIRVFLRMRPFNNYEMGEQDNAGQQWALLADRTAITLQQRSISREPPQGTASGQSKQTHDLTSRRSQSPLD